MALTDPAILARNAQALSQHPSPAHQAELLSRRAVLLARQHRLVEAAATLAQAHAVAPVGDPLAYCRLEITEAVLMSFHNRVDAAIARLEPLAQLLDAPDRLELRAEVHAVLALLRSRRMESDLSAQHAARALACASPQAHEVAYQCWLALAMAHAAAGAHDEAMSCFHRARRAAMQAGDDLALMSLSGAEAITRVGQVRQAIRRGDGTPAQIELALANMQAALERDAALGMHADTSAERVFEAELLLACGRSAQARRVVDAALESLILEGLPAHESLAWAIRAVCAAQAGETAVAKAARQRAESLAREVDAPEVIAPVLALCAQAAGHSGDRSRADTLTADAARAWQVIDAHQAQWRAALATLSLPSPGAQQAM